MLQNYQIRAAQIDLNRQRETMDFIRLYIDFLADNGYNTLLLYIAWRIKMKSHPYPPADEAYTADEVWEIVAYAFSKGLKVIPTTNLTYVNSLTRYPELKDMLEDGTRFWGSVRGNFCLSNPKVYQFIEDYLTELAEIVPSEYIHIGGDECWDLGYCDKCSAGGMNYDKEVAMYKEFILKCREIVVDKLHRKTIMWDDMFDYYPHLLADMPRDLIMAHWQYQDDVYTSMGHFGNRRRENRLEKYEELGFNYLLAPATNLTSNGRTFSEYAMHGKNLLGGIMTTWVTHLRFMYKVFPVIASIGRYWAGQGSEEDCFRAFVEKYFDNADELLLQALRCYSENECTRFTSFTALNICKQGFSGMRYGANARRNFELAILKNKYPQINNTVGKRIVEEIITMLELECAIFDLSKLIRDIPRKLTTPKQISTALKELQNKADNYSAKWNEWRPGITPNSIENYLNKFINNTAKNCEKLFKGNYLRILFASCNQYGAELLNISLVKNGEKILVKQGSFRGDGACYEQILPLDEAIEADTIVIEAQGYGGQGIAYTELKLGDKTFVPASASGEGMVSNPEFVMADDCTHAFMGSQDAMSSWKDRTAADQIHTLTIQLKQQ